ncbi:MAG TPA: GNAT family N-acetyltransferase [Pyrinomonadaceae bacterium]|nr:GNAT family N-acetyltransferase [Pyrinomonadaceae bacterium]
MSTGGELLQALKAVSQTIPVGDPAEAVLRPVATAAANLNRNDVRVLTEWRNRYVTSFLTEFAASEARTERWLTKTVGPDPTRILFMLDDLNGHTLGYLGLAFIDWEKRTGEADAIVRGVDSGPGLMSRALLTLLGWAHQQLGLTTSLSVRVRSDNPAALRFYLKFGVETRRVSLREVAEPDMRRWVEDESLSVSPVQLVYVSFHRHLYESIYRH